MKKVEVKGHSDQKLEWKQTDRRPDGADYITCLAEAVGNNYYNGGMLVETIVHQCWLLLCLLWSSIIALATA